MKWVWGRFGTYAGAWCVVTACLTFGATAQESTLPRFDVDAHCKEVADFAGGSQQMYGFCFDQEQSAYNSVKPVWGALPTKMQRHCQEVAEFAGSSYEMLDFCIKQEQKASGENAEKSFKF